MTIVYLIDYDINTRNGVMQKILQQSSVWVQEGHTVYYISTKTLSIYNSNLALLERFKPLSFSFGRLGTALQLLYSSFLLGKLLKKIKFDLIYTRYRLYMPFMTKELKKYKVIMEINSDDTLEFTLRSKVTHYYNMLTRLYVLNTVNGFICVSKELQSRFTYLNKPIEVIANGIDTSKYNLSQHVNKVPTFVFIGTPNQSWHGLDKIQKIAEHFKEYQFYIIGTNGTNTKNINYLGYLDQEKSTQIIQNSDFGIGTLSLYKKGLTEASPLKTRQYLACGIPIIYAYKDTDLKGNETFALRLTNDEKNINYDEINSFVQKVYHKKEIKEDARKFAVDTLEYNIKEKKRLAFFQKVLNET